MADECTVRDHVVSPQHNLDRVKLSIQHGVLGSFDRADGELLARLWNEHHRIASQTASPTGDVGELIERLRARIGVGRNARKLVNPDGPEAADALSELQGNNGKVSLAFIEAILHGDDEHRMWLLEAAARWNMGQPIPPPTGKGNKEALIAELQGRVERMGEALREIIDPVAAMQRAADAQGTTLVGRTAIELSESAAYLKSIARSALTGRTRS